MLNAIAENSLIDRLVRGLPRSPFQLNRVHQADAEILLLPGTSGMRLAVTTDTLAEEIRMGLYTEPGLIGWMTVMASMSDLAAVGASPLGILIAETIPQTCPESFLRGVQEGIGDACRACATAVLGGDTNVGEPMSLTGCAVGMLDRGEALTRVGCAPGEVLYVSGRLGSGNAYAFATLTGRNGRRPSYRPKARLAEGQMLGGFASACMDTSDGVLATLDQLMRLNGVGFVLEQERWQAALDPASRCLLQDCDLPEWFLLAGPHGEFELLFTLPPGREGAFLAEANGHGWHPLRLGRTIAVPEIRLAVGDSERRLDTGGIRNLASPTPGAMASYLTALREIGERCTQTPREETARR